MHSGRRIWQRKLHMENRKGNAHQDHITPVVSNDSFFPVGPLGQYLKWFRTCTVSDQVHWSTRTHFHIPLSLDFCTINYRSYTVFFFCRVQGEPSVRYKSVPVHDGTHSAVFPVSGSERKFSVWVQARNSLNSANSTVLSFTLNEIGEVVLQ